jgi:hypothetical protein
MGNPFADDGKCIYAVDMHNICFDAVIDTVSNIETLGREQFNAFVKDRLQQHTVLINEPLPINKLTFFKQSSAKANGRSLPHSKLAAARNDCSLFPKLYIACQKRSGELDTFFAHENQPTPPSLSSDGSMRFGTKSDLLACLDHLVAPEQQCLTVDCIIFDGAAVVQMIQAIRCKTFADYAMKTFVPYILSHFSKVSRLDLMWDQYFTGSLKAATRAKHGSGMRLRVMPSGSLPRNWSDFLRNADNKSELFHYLSSCVASVELTGNKQLIVTDGPHVHAHNVNDVSSVDPCNHDDADTRMILHLTHAVNSYHVNSTLRACDVDGDHFTHKIMI